MAPHCLTKFARAVALDITAARFSANPWGLDFAPSLGLLLSGNRVNQSSVFGQKLFGLALLGAQGFIELLSCIVSLDQRVSLALVQSFSAAVRPVSAAALARVHSSNCLWRPATS
jgi:hypothetical protein